jgi:hypothetical protein
MTKKVANRKSWRLAVTVAKAVAGRGWRAHLKEWNFGVTMGLRKLYDTEMSVARERAFAIKMRQILDRGVEQLDREYAAERARRVAVYDVIERFEIETDWKVEREARPVGSADEIVEEYLSKLETV